MSAGECRNSGFSGLVPGTGGTEMSGDGQTTVFKSLRPVGRQVIAGKRWLMAPRKAWQTE